MAYADLEAYEVITGTVVPEVDKPRITRMLESASEIIALYLGDREPEVSAEYGSLLADLVAARVYRLLSTPSGIRSESVGGSSVTYDTGAGSPFLLTADETRLLSMLLAGGRTAALRSAIMSSQGYAASGSVDEDEEV